jgi:hypothetical protein
VPTKTKSTASAPNEDAIRQRAYLMWEADGRPDGQAEHYWLKASEAPVKKLKAAAAKAAAPAVKAKPAKAAAKAPAKKKIVKKA